MHSCVLLYLLLICALSFLCPSLCTSIASPISPPPLASHVNAESVGSPPSGIILRADESTSSAPSSSSPPCDGLGSLTAWKAEWGAEDVGAPLSERQLRRLSAFSARPLKGWNSCGAFFWSVSEEEMMANINATIRMLLPSGYNIIELDWYCQPHAQHTQPTPALRTSVASA